MIVHPNIEPNVQTCLEELHKENWSSMMTISNVLEMIYTSLENPNVDSQLVGISEETYKMQAKKSTKKHAFPKRLA